MEEYGVDHAKIFAPTGVVYVRRILHAVDRLEASRAYYDLDDDVLRTTCLILDAHDRLSNIPAPPVPLVYRAMGWRMQSLLNKILYQWYTPLVR